MPEIPERRPYLASLELRDVDAVGGGPPYRFIEGQAVPFETWCDVGWYLELHEAGSFERSTTSGSGQHLPLLLFHNNRSFPVGRADHWDNADDGLHGVWQLNEHDDAQRAANMARNGELGGLSVGFQVIRNNPDRCVTLDWEEWNPDLGWDHMDRIVRAESRLLEVSLTPTPAFEEARVTLVRSAERRRERQERTSALDGWRREVERLRR